MRLLCLGLLGLMLFDSVADAAGCDDSNKAGAVECHTCACSVHIVPQRVVLAVAAPQAASYVPYEPSSYSFLSADSFFQPPRLRA